MQPLPSYTYVPGITPHPDTGGEESPAAGEGNAERRFQWGQTLFNHGYYWEAHEAWEGLWIEAGRRGPAADLLKGLIKLAACGVKCLEGNERGARRHARRAAELLRSEVERSRHSTGTESDPTPPPNGPHEGVLRLLEQAELERLIRMADHYADDPPLLPASRRDEATRSGVPVLEPIEAARG
jgi:hypothetical protein